MRLIVECGKYLFNKNVDINYVYDNEDTPLISSIKVPDYKFSPEVVQYLLENGADVNYRDKDGKTALYYFISCYRSSDWRSKYKTKIKPIDIFNLFIKSGADFNISDNDGISIKELIKNKYDFNKDLASVYNEFVFYKGYNNDFDYEFIYQFLSEESKREILDNISRKVIYYMEEYDERKFYELKYYNNIILTLFFALEKHNSKEIKFKSISILSKIKKQEVVDKLEEIFENEKDKEIKKALINSLVELTKDNKLKKKFRLDYLWNILN